MKEQRYEDALQMKEEYRTQMMHEQTRTDENQDKALDYTTKVTLNDNAKTSESSEKKGSEAELTLKDLLASKKK
jgi:hypothetical protein